MRKKIWIVLLVPIIAITVVAGIFLLKRNMETTHSQGQFQNQFQGMKASGMNEGDFEEMENIQNMEVVAASGVTGIGMVNEEFPIDSLTVSLEVEEVLVTSGQTVTNDTAVLKFTDESLETARKELESLLRDADLAYRAGKIEYEQALINAKYEYESAVLAGEQAEAVYAETIANMEENVEKTKEAYEDAKAEIAEYETALANNTYQTNVETAQAEYDENLQVLMKYMDEWGVEWSEVTGGGMGSRMQGNSTHSQYVSALQDMYRVLEANIQTLTAAEEEYDEKVVNVNITLQSLKLALPELSEAYANAQANYETSLVQAKLTKETTLTEAELAQKNYETNVEKAQADYEALLEAKEDAENNLAVFEAQMGDGYYYPTETGEIVRTSVRAGRDVTSGSSIFTISNKEEMTVTVSVDQADISKLKVGGAAMIQSSESGMYQGVISSINPVSNSSSRSSITYSVIVELTGNLAKLSANESVTVYFTVGGSDGE